MGVKQEDIDRAIANGNKFMAQLKQVCPKPGETLADRYQITTVKKKRIRQSSKPLLNRLETEFLHWIYGELSSVFSSPCVMMQSVRFKLGNGIWYKPDFVFIRPAGTWTAYEVKGKHLFRGGIENLKVAASQYPLIQWVLAYKEEGKWITQVVLP